MRRTGETGCVGARIRIPLQVLLPWLAVSLVAFGAVAVGIADVSGARGYLMRQADDDLQALREQHAESPLRGRAGLRSGLQPGVARSLRHGAVEREGAAADPRGPGAAPGPAIPVGGWRLPAHVARPVTVPGAGASGRWRVVIEAVHYQPQRILYVYGADDVKYVIGGRTVRGPGGVLVLMAGLGDIGRITERVAAGYAIAAGAVLVLWPARGSPWRGPSCGRSARLPGSRTGPGQPRAGTWRGLTQRIHRFDMTLTVQHKPRRCIERRPDAAERAAGPTWGT
jgi:hypothetical protein